jgi:hypothetical protein
MASRFASIAIAFGFAAATQVSGQQKPVVEYDVFVDYQRPPSTLAALTNAADLVVVGSIASTRNIVNNETGHESASTEVRLSVMTVLKGSGVTRGNIVPILRPGGDVDLGDKIRRSTERGFPRFQVGDRYLLFLHWNALLGVYEVFYGPNGAFQLVADKLRAIGTSGLAKQYDGRRASSVIQDIRRGTTGVQ